MKYESTIFCFLMFVYLSLDASAITTAEDSLTDPGILEDPFKDPDMVGGGLVPDRGGLPSLSVQSRLVISLSSEEPSLVRDPLFGKMDFFFFLQ